MNELRARIFGAKRDSLTESGAPVFHSLTGLRFVLACWIAYFHVGLMFDSEGFGALPLLELGMTRVDVFFVLSGFVLAHVYWAREGAKFNFADFMVARVSRLYPLFLLALAVIGAYLVAGAAIGQGVEPGRYPLRDLAANLFMLQSFGLTTGGDWNFPAWAISAEFAGYAAFPLYLVVAAKLRARPVLLLGVSLAVLGAAELFHHALTGRALNTATEDWGALRGAAAMFVGVGARAAFDRFRVSIPVAALIALAGALFAVAAAVLHAGVTLVAIGAVGFILGLARIDAAGGRTPLGAPIMRRLGAWSYAIFILHVPAFIILSQGLEILDIPFVANVWTAGALVAALCIPAAIAHHLIEEPARKAIRAAWKRRSRRAPAAGVSQAAA
jgi:peptidoglycan/LPS O-acetylase OafA/YrhL